jgi:hypothetical protein
MAAQSRKDDCASLTAIALLLATCETRCVVSRAVVKTVDPD